MNDRKYLLILFSKAQPKILYHGTSYAEAVMRFRAANARLTDEEYVQLLDVEKFIDPVEATTQYIATPINL